NGAVLKIMRPMMIYEAFDVVTVPFPFTDQEKAKKRPALVLSNAVFNQENNHLILAMITSSGREAWHGDLKISNLEQAGLRKASVIRLKLFTLDSRLIIQKIGTLDSKEANLLKKQFGSVLICP
ncbi:MAG: type II toxin-antitoxin system PemK/MazF family toxin, partial [Gammaproteobacteria bacterium]